MFYAGSLQSGISAAMQQSKAVVCFVHDEGNSSKEWEHTIVNDEQVSKTLGRTAVVLRIPARSQEAAFLSSFCPISALPTVAIIQDGATKRVISSASAAVDELKHGIIAQLDQLGDSHANTAGEVANATPTQEDEDVSLSDSPHPETRRSSQQASSSTTSSTPSSHTSRQRHPVPSTGEDSLEQAVGPQSDAQRSSQMSAAPESSDHVASPTAKPTPRQDWLKLQRAREEEQRRERERIKAQIRRDHEERRRRGQDRLPLATAMDSGRSTGATPSQSNASEVRVQVRTFDGSTLRTKLSRQATIVAQIRPWIDEAVGQSLPYDLKIILGPLSNRTIEPAEEEKTLEDLELLGSCTLVMFPVKGYVDSYAPSGSGIIGSVFSEGYKLLSGSLSTVVNGVSSIIGSGQVSSAPEPLGPLPGTGGQPAGPSSGQVRVRTLADQRREAEDKDPQFYNGNQLDFEPRKDDGEEGRE